jgi:hypothetical protein
MPPVKPQQWPVVKQSPLMETVLVLFLMLLIRQVVAPVANRLSNQL